MSELCSKFLRNNAYSALIVFLTSVLKECFLTRCDFVRADLGFDTNCVLFATVLCCLFVCVKLLPSDTCCSITRSTKVEHVILSTHINTTANDSL